MGVFFEGVQSFLAVSRNQVVKFQLLHERYQKSDVDIVIIDK
jgi:hypothetical protein